MDIVQKLLYTGYVEEVALQFQPERSPLIFPDVDCHKSLSVERCPTDEERYHYRHCNHTTPTNITSSLHQYI